jgi:hypothetical protein
MTAPFKQLREDFSCSVVKRTVRVTANQFDLRGLAIARTMESCDGARLCGLFPSPASFKRAEPTGCDYRAALGLERLAIATSTAA